MVRIIPATLLFLTGCVSGEANDTLPNGYRFVELSDGNGAIVSDEGDFAVYPNVLEYRLENERVVGKRVLATDNTDYSHPFTEGLGYFVFDTRTGELIQGLSKPEVE
ncbi:hypothetical protein [Aurantiacibacter hainanensis]|uniref:hypothetical protein n=1 Tax=Aurantiacibacter hainanensis TaxID=3076114 RepID=UPI0030C71AE5